MEYLGNVLSLQNLETFSRELFHTLPLIHLNSGKIKLTL